VRSARPDPATERGPASRSDREHDADGVAGDQRTPLPQQDKTAQPRTPVPSQPPRREQKALLKDQKALLKDQKALQKEQKARQKEQKRQSEPERRRQASAPPRQDTAVPGAPASKRAQPAAQRGRSSRRSRRLSSRKLLLLVAGAVVIVVGGVAFALRPVSSGPAHVLATPPKLGAYVQDQQLADGMDAASLKASIVAKSGGEAQHVVDAVYEETTGPGTASGPVIILFIGGNLSGASAESFITSFTGKLKGAVPTSPGTLGGDAACVPSVGGHPAECAWADNDTFGVIASPTLGAGGLASELRLMRPMVEHTAR
jgi:outer membrane biosynthesis protein TonB